MQVEDLEHFRSLLLERSQHLAAWLNGSAGADSQEVEKVQVLVAQIKAALERIEGESYGTCAVCSGHLDYFQLEAQPEATICIACLDKTERTLLEEDLNMASKMQRALLPSQVPDIDGFAAAARWTAARVVGGDYYDFLPCDGADQFSRVVIADAMGHGVSAALLMSNLQGALRVLSLEARSPAELVGRLNQWLCRNVATTKFISMVNLCLERTDSRETLLTYVNAGHCPPILARRDGSIERLDATGGVLGIHEQFRYRERTTSLWSGDLVMLYTDGITEATNSLDEQFEDHRLTDFVQSHRKEDVDAILDKLRHEIDRFCGSSSRDDDLTVIVLRKL